MGAKSLHAEIVETINIVSLLRILAKLTYCVFIDRTFKDRTVLFKLKKELLCICCSKR